MARVVMQAVVSVDGYIAYPDDTVGPLFDWYFNGDTELSARQSGWTFAVSPASFGYVQPFWDAIKVTVIGRHLFDTTNGWDGKPSAGDELVVVTHRPLPDEWLAAHPDAPFHHADSVEAGIALAEDLAGDGSSASPRVISADRRSRRGWSTRSRWTSSRWFWAKGCASSAATPARCSSTIPTGLSRATACCTCTTRSGVDPRRGAPWVPAWRVGRRSAIW